MREKRWLLLALYGLVLANVVSAALKGTRPKFKIATTSTSTTTTEESTANENDDDEPTTTTTPATTETNATTGHVLTGIPQIDYIWDPNLPRELNGYNLSDYPFYNSIPEDIDFKCDGLHDGFYASVPHKCQVYHHCLYGTRYDFLCANFTAFDQKTFICHFVSEVDCPNSKKYWHRNDALYKAATTSTTSTSTTTTTTTPAPVTPAGRSSSRDRDLPRRRRPHRRRPAYDYDDEYFYEDYSRPRGYGRDDYDYEDRKYWRDRDREFRDRDRDYRDRDAPRFRDGVARDDRDRDTSARDRYPSRNNRRDPSRTRDPLEEDARVRPRDPDQGSRSREVDDTELEDRRTEDRRYSDKRYRDEYEDKEAASSSAASIATGDGLVKPSAPVASVYARPRAPPKIRRPVPLSEQEKYAYKATTVPSTEDSRRRPIDEGDVDYEDEEDFRTTNFRRPMRRRPSYRERDRDYYDTRDRDRDRDRDRPFRPRYRDEEEDLRPRKHSDRSRDRYYDRDRDRGVDRGRDRSLDRGKDRAADRPVDRDRGRTQETEKQERPYSSRPADRDREDRSRTGSRSKDLQDPTDAPPRRGNNYERPTTVASTSTTCLPEQLIHKVESNAKESDRSERPLERPPERSQRPGTTTRAPLDDEEPRRAQEDYQESEQEDRRDQGQYQSPADEYSQEYDDETEDPPVPSPRTAVRIVKRPFVPSRGGNANPRGLSPVGSKATTPRREEERERVTDRPKSYYAHEETQDRPPEHNQQSKPRQEEKETYNAYKTVLNNQDSQRDHRPEEYDSSLDRPAVRRPGDRQREEERQKHEEQRQQNYEEGLSKWPGEDYSSAQNNEGRAPSRSKGRANENPNVYGTAVKNEENQEHPTGPGNFRIKQRLNEVTHRLQDIPESEYDVTLNEALTPTLNQEANFPSGFVLPLHAQQLGRDTILQPSENNYKVSRPVNQQQPQEKPFMPSPQFLPAVSGNDRQRTVYYRPAETVQLSGAQYRPQRGQWHDYTGY